MLELRLQHRLRLGLIRTARRRRAARARARAGLTVLIALVALSGCGQGGAGSGPQAVSDPASPSAASSTGTPVSASAAPAGGGGQVRGRLAYSSPSAEVVQAQPAHGSCHAIGSGPYSRPDPRCTPGALNPAVTQATIGHTICHSGWTKTVRPPARITDREKVGSMAAYGDRGSIRAYEYDHLVPLELGGAVNDARNLWPEPGTTPNPKDAIENGLRRQVCDGAMRLAQAQREIATDWVALARSPRRTTATVVHSAQNAECTVSASYSSRYHDYDIYVHSSQPDQTVVVSDVAGDSAHWHTDSSGYADVFLRASVDDAGQGVTAHVGDASCQGVL